MVRCSWSVEQNDTAAHLRESGAMRQGDPANACNLRAYSTNRWSESSPQKSGRCDAAVDTMTTGAILGARGKIAFQILGCGTNSCTACKAFWWD